MKVFIALGLALFVVTVQGTKIDRLPSYVGVLVDKPDEEALRLIKKGGSAIENTTDAVHYHRVKYFFNRPDELKTDSDLKFSAGDVIYVYLTETAQERDAFIEKFALKGVGKRVKEDGTLLSLYCASPGYYVTVLTKHTEFWPAPQKLSHVL